MAEKEKLQEDIKKEKEREVALKNLKAGLVDVGASYFVHKSEDYGKADNSAMENYKYFPAFNSGIKSYDENGDEYDVLQNSVLASREEDSRYSGNVSELKIMKDCAAIIGESLNSIKVSDLVSLMGADMKLKDKFKNAYVSDIAPKKMSKEEYNKLHDEQKKAMKASLEVYQNLIESYQTYLVRTKVSEAMAESAKEIPKGLEAILAEPEKPKEE